MMKRILTVLMLMMAFALPALGEQAEQIWNDVSPVDWDDEELTFYPGDYARGAIGAIQNALLNRGFYTEDDYVVFDAGDGDQGVVLTCAPSAIDGPTEAAIRRFQADAGLPETGAVDRATLDALLPDFARREGLKAKGYLVLGSEGEQVYEMQSALRALGIYDGSLSGHFGSVTEAAVMKWQEENGLTADGAVDAAQLEAICGTEGSGAR